MVAKSYQSMKQVSAPFNENGKMYVIVQKDNGTTKKVRWYNENEYAKMYAADPVQPTDGTNYRRLLGFGYAGYITIFRGYSNDLEWWFDHSVARYHCIFGWYVVSDDAVPIDLPNAVQPVRLDWDRVGDGVRLRGADEVRAAVNAVLYGESKSQYQGSVGDRFDLTITVINSQVSETKYGNLTTHTFEDSEGNQYLWITGAKNWEKGAVKTIRASIKEHKIINNIQTTILTRCVETK
jgi:hypothetical protein